jgi:hypothetical protein
MKIIFLDIDGVLVNDWSLSTEMIDVNDTDGRIRRCHRFSGSCVDLLNHIIDSTGAKIVVSSTWRMCFNSFQTLVDYMKDQGIKGEVIGRTPTPDEYARVRAHVSSLWLAVPRGNEIQMWLDEHKDLNVEKFVILDDNSDMEHLSHRLVQTDFDAGLTERKANYAISKLS